MKTTLAFKYTGEWITQRVRELFWQEQCSYTEVERICMELLKNDKLSEVETKYYIRLLIEGKMKLQGVTPELEMVEDNKDASPIDELIKDNQKLKLKLSQSSRRVEELEQELSETKAELDELNQKLEGWERIGEHLMNQSGRVKEQNSPIHKLRVALGKSNIIDENTFYFEIFTDRGEETKQEFNEFCEQFGIYPGMSQHGYWRWVNFYDKKTDQLLNVNDFISRGIAIVEEKPEKESNDNASADIKEQEPEIVKERLGWVSPSGEFFESDWGTHEESALQIIAESNWKTEYKDWKLNGNPTGLFLGRDFLVFQKNYVLLDNPLRFGHTQVTCVREKLTKKQRDFLFGYFSDLGDMFQANAYMED